MDVVFFEPTTRVVVLYICCVFVLVFLKLMMEIRAIQPSQPTTRYRPTYTQDNSGDDASDNEDLTDWRRCKIIRARDGAPSFGISRSQIPAFSSEED